jgi:hypothetical protein
MRIYTDPSVLPQLGIVNGTAPTSRTGPGWTATYYAGSTTTGTPLGSEVVTSLNVTATPAIVTAADATTWSVAYSPSESQRTPLQSPRSVRENRNFHP